MVRDGKNGLKVRSIDSTGGFIEHLVGKDRMADFFKETWERQPLLLRPNPASSLRDFWMTPEDVDELFCSIDFPLSNFNMADGVQPLSVSSYAPGGAINRDQVTALHRKGATIILRAAQRWSRKLRRVCACLEWDFGFPAQANIYLTPPGKKSTPPHWDTHDLFILQVAGEKRWKLFASDYSLPLDSQRFEPSLFSAGALKDEITITTGEVLYLPRGVIHEPVANSYSIHVSLGILVSRWADLLRDLVEVAAPNHEQMRGAIDFPSGRLDSASEEELVERLLERVELLMDRKSCKKAVHRHMLSLLGQHGDHREQQLLSIMRSHGITPESQLRRISSAYLWIEETESRLHVHWRRGEFSLPRECRPFLEFVASGKVFTIGDAPKWGSTDQHLAFCQALLEQGLVEEVSNERGELECPVGSFR